MDYDEQGADGRLAAVILDQLRAAPELGYSLPWPDDVRLRGICEALYEQPDLSFSLAQWSEQLHISEKTLTRQFQRDTGLSFAPGASGCACSARCRCWSGANR